MESDLVLMALSREGKRTPGPSDRRTTYGVYKVTQLLVYDRSDTKCPLEKYHPQQGVRYCKGPLLQIK